MAFTRCVYCTHTLADFGLKFGEMIVALTRCVNRPLKCLGCRCHSFEVIEALGRCERTSVEEVAGDH